MIIKRFLAELACTVADDDIDDDGFLAILGLELLLHSLDETVVVMLIDEVDGASSETAAHDAAARDALLLGHVVEEVEFFAADLVFLG